MDKRGITLTNIIILLGISLIIIASILLYREPEEKIQDIRKLSDQEMIDIKSGVSFKMTAFDKNKNILKINLENTGTEKIAGFNIKVYSASGVESIKDETVLDISDKKTITLNLQFPVEVEKVEVIPGIIFNNDIIYLFDTSVEFELGQPPTMLPPPPTTPPPRCISDLECHDNNPLTIDICENFYCSYRNTKCSDNIDNDNDNLTDLEDPNCKAATDDSESSAIKAQCNDNIDNDLDELIDLADPGCSDLQDNNESDEETCVPITEICNDVIDNDCDSLIDTEDPDCAQQEINFILNYWSPWIDLMDDSEWAEYLNTVSQLNNMGFTHAGIKIWNPIDNAAIVSARISELRNNGLKIGLHHSAGHKLLIKQDQIDPANHTNNNQNLKYFDSNGFNAYSCANLCDGEKRECCNGQEYIINEPACPASKSTTHNCGCIRNPTSRAHDPAYDGLVWQNELSYIDTLMNTANILPSDIVVFDTEVWALPNYVDACYPNTLMNSVARYTGATLSDRHNEYNDYKFIRALDIRNKAKNRNQQISVLFYDENIPELAHFYFPPGSGDASAPQFYLSPNLTALQDRLNEGNFTGSYPWISFSTTRKELIDVPGTGFITIQWDPDITQELGFMLKREGVYGVIIYPGPSQHGLSSAYFLEHAQALINGFINGIEPLLAEKCADNIDNDGDGQIDENC